MRPTLAFLAALPLAASMVAAVPECSAQATSAVERTQLVGRILATFDTVKSSEGATTALDKIRPFLQDPLSANAVIPSQALLEQVLADLQAVRRRPEGLVLTGISGYNAGGEASAAAGAAGVGASGVWLPSEADLILGLTDFVVERARDEATYSFVLGLQRALAEGGPTNATAAKLVTTGFPRSYALIQTIDVESFQSLMPPIRSAFAADLASLPQAMGTPEFVAAMGWQAGSAEQQYAQGVSLVFSRGVEIARGEAPAIALSRFADLTSAELASDNARRALRLLGIVSREYALAGDSALFALLSQPKQRALFASFMVGDMAVSENFGIAKAGFIGRVRERQNDITLLVQQFEAARGALEAVRKDTTRTSSERTRDLVGAVLPMIATAWRFSPDGSATPAFVDDAMLLQHALAERNYTAVSSWLLERLPAQMKNGNVVRYVAFGSSLASARNSDEVTAALRTAAAPVGSYRMKRNNYRRATDPADRPKNEWLRSFGPGGVSITAFAGGAWAKETVEDGDSEDALGIAVPVGVEFSLGAPFGSGSVFVSVLDLGNVASRRLGEGDDVQSGAEVGWEQVFAPGAYLVWGIARTPVALGFGVQHVGGLRESRGASSEQLDVVRWGVFLGADLTLFRF